MTEQAISPLRRRMIEDMTIRKFAQKTQHDYVQRVKDFANYLKRSPDTAKAEDVRGFQLHLTSSGAGIPKINITISALRFFFNVTLDRPDLSRHLSTLHNPRKVPVILSPDEMARFLEAAPGIKYKAAFSAQAPPDPTSGEDPDRHLMMTISEPSPAKAVPLSGRSSPGHGSARSHVASTSNNRAGLHRHTARRSQQRIAPPPVSPASPVNRPSLLTSVVARPRLNPHSKRAGKA
jgi:hypothetical protein